MTQDQAILRRPGAAGPAFRRVLTHVDKRAALLAGVVLGGWCLTGTVLVKLDRRAVYERFGTPVAVLHPGLHVVAPWPFSHLRFVDYGQMRDVALAAAPGLHALYRVGLTDAQAMDAAYGSTDPDGLVQSAASQAPAPDGDTGALQAWIQASLDRVYSGLELIGIAGAKQASGAAGTVPAAAITAQTIVAQARSAAAIARTQARQTAAAQVAGARAKAAEMVAAARSGLVEFTADRAANAADGKSFLLERYFANLSKAIAKSPKTIIDHRLNWPTAPELDLRPPPGVADAITPPGKGN